MVDRPGYKLNVGPLINMFMQEHCNVMHSWRSSVVAKAVVNS